MGYSLIPRRQVVSPFGTATGIYTCQLPTRPRVQSNAPDAGQAHGPIPSRAVQDRRFTRFMERFDINGEASFAATPDPGHIGIPDISGQNADTVIEMMELGSRPLRVQDEKQPVGITATGAAEGHEPQEHHDAKDDARETDTLLNHRDEEEDVEQANDRPHRRKNRRAYYWLGCCNVQ
ncbi:hypothetical protein J1614_003635 [Plenodomus biglobosus]|nr:hypothetical protein J1614_003635 [Plenodomus biglobosus]